MAETHMQTDPTLLSEGNTATQRLYRHSLALASYKLHLLAKYMASTHVHRHNMAVVNSATAGLSCVQHARGHVCKHQRSDDVAQHW
jgi:hypothetical protein